MTCCKRKGDVRKCIPFYVVGGILLLCGVPLMIVGIVTRFMGADLVGYVGGACILFGLGFILLWHNFTIKDEEKNISPTDYDPDLKDIRDVVEKSRRHESSSMSAYPYSKEESGISNPAFETVNDGGGTDSATSNQNGSLGDRSLNGDKQAELHSSQESVSPEPHSKRENTIEKATGDQQEWPDVEILTSSSSARSQNATDDNESPSNISRTSIPVEVA